MRFKSSARREDSRKEEILRFYLVSFRLNGENFAKKDFYHLLNFRHSSFIRFILLPAGLIVIAIKFMSVSVSLMEQKREITSRIFESLFLTFVAEL